MATKIVRLREYDEESIRISSKDLRSIPKEQREKILKQQTEIAIFDYDIIPDAFDIVED